MGLNVSSGQAARHRPTSLHSKNLAYSLLRHHVITRPASWEGQQLHTTRGAEEKLRQRRIAQHRVGTTHARTHARTHELIIKRGSSSFYKRSLGLFSSRDQMMRARR